MRPQRRECRGAAAVRPRDRRSRRPTRNRPQSSSTHSSKARFVIPRLFGEESLIPSLVFTNLLIYHIEFFMFFPLTLAISSFYKIILKKKKTFEFQEQHSLIGVANVFLEVLLHDLRLDYQASHLSFPFFFAPLIHRCGVSCLWDKHFRLISASCFSSYSCSRAPSR